jgi:hypothetical protein
MKKIIFSFMLASILSVTALAGAADNPKKEAAAGNGRLVRVNLRASNYNEGALGMATFVAMNESCEVEFYIARISRWIERPVHIYTYIYPGSCAKLGDKPAYEMNETTTMNRTGDDAWRVTKGLPVALSSLLAISYAIVVRSSPADGNLDLFCGDIR